MTFTGPDATMGMPIVGGDHPLQQMAFALSLLF